MFELSIACKYLVPRWKQLSVSIISLVSTLVIALVVWLIVVFFSVKDGLENSWIDKITALTAPVRIIPTDKYYKSYYHLVDSISAKSDYSTKSIGEKLLAELTDPYDANLDEEVPHEWEAPDVNDQNQLKDLVKIAFQSATSLSEIEGIKASDYEAGVANMRIRLLRNLRDADKQTQQFLEQASLVGSFDADTHAISKALIPATSADFNHLLYMQTILSDNIKEENLAAVHRVENGNLQNNLHRFFNAIEVTSLITPSQGWQLPLRLLINSELFGVAVSNRNKITKIVIPSSVQKVPDLMKHWQSEGFTTEEITLRINADGKPEFKLAHQDFKPFPYWIDILLPGGETLPAQLIEKSIDTAKTIPQLRFAISTKIQNYPLTGYIGLGQLEIGKAKIKSIANIFMATANKHGIAMPTESHADPVLLPKRFKDSGALIGDQGYLSYYTPTPSTMQEQRIPVYIAGFYDPGIIPMGGKYILASRNLTALIRGSYDPESMNQSNGINVRFTNIADAPKVKVLLQEALKKAGIAQYWHVETFHEYDFSKDIIQQLQSEKNLFSLISLVIIVVACSNIISMLIILVNDKKLEIGILRSMGATSGSIAAIFGICGMVMGAVGSLVGILAAILTLKYVNELVGFMSQIQGHDLFNPVFYGSTLPTELSLEALLFVLLTTVVISLLAGIVPAFKASMMRPSAILRAE